MSFYFFLFPSQSKMFLRLVDNLELHRDVVITNNPHLIVLFVILIFKQIFDVITEKQKGKKN